MVLSSSTTFRRIGGVAIAAGALTAGLAFAWQASPQWRSALTGATTSDASTAGNAGNAAPPTHSNGLIAQPLQVRIRDSVTGRALPGGIALQALDSGGLRSAAVSAQGAAVNALTRGRYAMYVRAPGYEALQTPVVADGAPMLPTTIWLTPDRPSADLDRQALAAVDCGNCSTFSGYVYDAQSGKPLAGAQVESASGERATTDAQGRFVLTVPARFDAADSEAVPPTTTLTLRLPGYRQQQLTDLLLPNDASDLIVDLQPGHGTQQVPAAHSRLSESHAPGATQRLLAETAVAAAPAPTSDLEKALSALHPERAALAQQLAVQAAAIPVPASIRVGTGCSGRSCTGVSVYSMEDYVGRGLDDEWISSWNAQSLAAGAVAYRSYGAWFVAHPVSTRYDICSTTSCQVFRPGAVSSTVAAAAATRGVLLTRDGRTAAFAEYSAENNAWDDRNDGLNCSNTDLSCGNGYNGSPRNNWPCLSDSVGRNRGCFGHGRGMSQWGTQRWAAQGRDWKWIANHYFNANNRPGGMRNAFLANLPSGGVKVLDGFESGVGHFDRSPSYSGSTKGIAASSAASRDCTQAHVGSCALRVLLQDDAASSSDWMVRLLSGSGEPAQNVALTRANGQLGFWVFSGGSGMRVGVSIDDNDGTERSVMRTLTAGQWTFVSWSLTDPAQWNAWAGGSDGQIDAATVRLDAIWFERAQTSYNVNLYLDEVQIRN